MADVIDRVGTSDRHESVSTCDSNPKPKTTSWSKQRAKKLHEGKNDLQQGKKMEKNGIIFPAHSGCPKTKSGTQKNNVAKKKLTIQFGLRVRFFWIPPVVP